MVVRMVCRPRPGPVRQCSPDCRRFSVDGPMEINADDESAIRQVSMPVCGHAGVRACRNGRKARPSRLWPGPRPIKPCATGRKMVKPAVPARIPKKHLPGAEIAGESEMGTAQSGRNPNPGDPGKTAVRRSWIDEGPEPAKCSSPSPVRPPWIRRDLRVPPDMGLAVACEAPSGQNARRQSERRTSSESACLRWPG